MCGLNKIFIKRGQQTYLAKKLVNGRHAIQELMGKNRAGNNPYQHIQPLVRQGIVVTKIPVPNDIYHEYTIADAVSRAMVKNALDSGRG